MSESKTPRSSKFVGLVYTHKYLGSMFDEMVSMETELAAANAQVEELHEILRGMIQVSAEVGNRLLNISDNVSLACKQPK